MIRKTLLFLLFTISIGVFSQSKKDSIPARLDSITKLSSGNLFSDLDIIYHR